MDIAVVGAGAVVELDDHGRCRTARIALGAVAPTAVLVPEAAQTLLGTQLTADDLERAAAAAGRAGDPISDKRGPAAYRRRLAGVLTRRVLAVAIDRARQRSAR
jgi:carbon-monoxide dehydrogenase medium subunit